MAEIKSTWEMVMEKADRIAAKADTVSSDDELLKKGMRIGAEYIKSNGALDISAQLNDFPANEKTLIFTGCYQTLARNIILPRDGGDDSSATLALDCLNLLGEGNEQVSSTCAELKQILEQYLQHKGQAVQQLEDALKGQLEQHATSQGQDPGAVNPRTHPQYQEEKDKMLSDLNSQYSQALGERKEIIKQGIIG